MHVRQAKNFREVCLLKHISQSIGIHNTSQQARVHDRAQGALAPPSASKL